MEIYHGGPVVVDFPDILENRHRHTCDFGPGFYCTTIYKQANRWAFQRNGFVSVYEYCPTYQLHYKEFSIMTEEWLDFIKDCRQGINHPYDIVSGPMADDKIWRAVEDYIAGRISRNAFWELTKTEYPTHQICFCTTRSLDCLTFVNAAKGRDSYA